METIIPIQDGSWVNRIVSSTAFDDYEGKAIESLNKYGVESGFCAQYFRDGRMDFHDFNIGKKESVRMAIPHGSDRLVHVHYHPSSYISPSLKDIQEADRDTAILSGKLEVPPVHMIGAKVDGSPLYLARQRKKFPGYVERFILTRTKPEKWRLFSRRMYEMECNKLLYDEIVRRLGEEKERGLRGRPFEEMLELSGISYTDIAKMNAKALKKSYGYKTGVIGSANKFPDSYPISDKRGWIYGNGELFE